MKETAGGGSASTVLVSDTLYSWDQMLHAGHAPSEFSFRGKLPVYYLDGRKHGLSLLPPSYDARMNALPGFRVAVQYEFVVSVTRTRDLPLLWKKTARCVRGARFHARFAENAGPPHTACACRSCTEC